MFKNLNRKQNLISLPQEEKQRRLLFILAIMILAILVILFFYFRSSPSKTSIISETNSLSDNKEQILAESIIDKIDFDNDFLKNSFFQSLKAYGKWPLKIDQKGRANPFLPY